MPVLFSALVAITNLCGTVSVDTHGARVVSYVPVGGGEVFFRSKTGTGGMPICWPWFAGLGPCRDSARHGVARYRDFKVTSVKKHAPWDSEILLRLESDADTRRAFPHDFALDVSVRLTDRLTVKMIGENTGEVPFAVTEALHPYFAVEDSVQCRVDDVSSAECRLGDLVGGTGLSLKGDQGVFRVWRPNSESAHSKNVSLIMPDDWKKFICVEIGTFEQGKAYLLKPGERHALTGTIRLSVTHANAKPLDVQSLIDGAAASGGGVVTIPPGEWLTRAIRLKSNVELHLSKEATLVFRDETEACLPVVRTSYSAIEYNGLSPLIYAYGATNVSITGNGVIAPRMALWREWFLRDTPVAFESQRQLYEWGENDIPVEKRRFPDPVAARLRPCCVEFERCRNVRLADFSIRESPLWCVHLRLCEDVLVRGLDIRARGHNNDGIDVNASRNVLIEGCALDQGDDGIVIKSGRDRDGRRVGVPCENVEIRDCVARSGRNLLAIGSEVSGGVRNIFLHDCRADGPVREVVNIKTSDRKGAFIENVVVSNVTVNGGAERVVGLVTNAGQQWERYPAREQILTKIANIRIEDVKVDSVRRVCHLVGDTRLPVQGLSLKRIGIGDVREKSRVENVVLETDCLELDPTRD